MIFKKLFISLYKKKTESERRSLINSVKSSLLISAAPCIIIISLLLYNKINAYIAALVILTIFCNSFFVIRPYIKNLNKLKLFLSNLADQKENTDSNELKDLSLNIERAEQSWNAKISEIELLCEENKILFETSKNILIFLDKKLKIININAQAIEVLGLDSANINSELIFSDKNLTKQIKDAEENQKSINTEAQLNINNKNLDFEIQIEPVLTKSTDHKISLILIMSDITSSKEKNKRMKNFITNASHEILTPLTSIIGFIETLKNLETHEEETRQRFLSVIEKKSQQMSVLVRDLVLLARVDKENDNKNFTKDVNIMEVIETSIDNFYFFARKKNIKLVQKIEKNIPYITGNKEELVTALNNLISNAIKYGFENTEITVNAGVEDPKDKKPKLKTGTNILFVSVINTGYEISKKDIAHLTQRFYRGQNSSRNDVTGFGLGLAIVKEILDKHCAALTIKSISKNTNIFTVRLPVQKKELNLIIEPESSE